MKYSYIAMFIFISTLWGGIVPAPDYCPIVDLDEFEYYSNQKVDIDLPNKFILGKNDIKITLSKPNFPSGYIVAAYVDLLSYSSTKEPEIEDGYPLSSIETFENGNYTIELKVNLIYKGS